MRSRVSEFNYAGLRYYAHYYVVSMYIIIIHVRVVTSYGLFCNRRTGYYYY